MIRQFTTRSRVLVIAGVLFLIIAFFSRQREVLWLGAACLVLVLASFLWSKLPLGKTEVIRSHPDSIQVGESAEIHLTVRSAKFPRLLRLEEVISPSLGSRPRFTAISGQEITSSYSVTATMRGVQQIGPLLARCEDPFGLTRSDHILDGSETLLVTPQIFDIPFLNIGSAGLREGESSTNIAAFTGKDDVLVREYHPGDDVRRVHWRSTAKTGNLMVRKEEHSWEPRAKILLDNRAISHAGSGATSSFEFAVSLAASIALQLNHQGYRLTCNSASDEILNTLKTGTLAKAKEQIIETFTWVNASTDENLNPVSVDTKHFLVGIFGRLNPQDLDSLPATGVGIVLNVETFAGFETGSAAEAAELLERHGWRTVIVDSTSDLTEVWPQLAGAL